MVKFEAFVRKVIREFNEAGFEYALTGALAVSYYGRPRTTADVDVILRISPMEFGRFASVLKRVGLDAELQAVKRAWDSRYRIVSFDSRDGLRLDVMMTDVSIPRRRVRVLHLSTYLQDPTWLLLSKLRLMKVTADGDRKALDRQDVLSVLRNAEVDIGLLKEESKRQMTFDVLQEMLADAEVLA